YRERDREAEGDLLARTTERLPRPVEGPDGPVELVCAVLPRGDDTAPRPNSSSPQLVVRSGEEADLSSVSSRAACPTSAASSGNALELPLHGAEFASGLRPEDADPDRLRRIHRGAVTSFALPVPWLANHAALPLAGNRSWPSALVPTASATRLQDRPP